MYFEEFGKENKKTIIFIHGAMWPRSFCCQKDLSDEYHTVFFQMSGHGKECDERFSREKVVHDVMKYVRDNKIKKPHLAGFSLGTQITLMIMNRYSKAFDKFVLISPLIDASDEDIARIKFGMKAGAVAAKSKPLAHLAASILKVESDMRDEFIKEMKAQKPIELANDIMSERLESNELTNISEINNPVYIAVGGKDNDCFQNSGRKLKNKLKNATMMVFPDSGHNVPISDKEKLNYELRLFLKS